MSIVTRLAAVLVAAVASPAAAQEPKDAKESKVVWQKGLSAAYRASAAEKKPMLVCFTDSSLVSAKQKQMIAEGALDPFRDRAVFVFADPDADDSFRNVKQKVAELGIKQFPTMVLVSTATGGFDEVGRIEGSLPREEIEKGMMRLLKVPGVEWHNVQFDKLSWVEELGKVYDKAAAAKLPVALLFVSPGCKPGDVCACSKYLRDLVPTIGFQGFAKNAVFVFVEIPADYTKVSADVGKLVVQFMQSWNVTSMPTLIVADPTPTGLVERSRVTGRWVAEIYIPKMTEAFGPAGEAKKNPAAGFKPVTADDLVKYFERHKAEVKRTPEGGLKSALVLNRDGTQVNATVELRVSDDARRVVGTVELGDVPADATALKRVTDEVAAFRRLTIAYGPTRLTTDGGRVRVTAEVFNEGENTDLPNGVVQSVGHAGVAFLRAVAAPPKK